MSEINLQLVREFFELNYFHVFTNWQQETPGPIAPDHTPQLLVTNSDPRPSRDLPPVLGAADLAGIHCAVVEVRAWHSDRFYPSTIIANPVITQFAKPEPLAAAKAFFGTDEFRTVLVISELPQSAEPRELALEVLQSAGVQHVLEFPSLLRDLVGRVSINGAYAASHTLQFIQLAKRYRLFRAQQMEFSFVLEPPPARGPLQVETVDVPGDDAE